MSGRSYRDTTASNVLRYLLPLSLEHVRFSIELQEWEGRFKLIYLRSIAKQVIPTYINHSRPLIPDGIPLFFKPKVTGSRPTVYIRC